MTAELQAAVRDVLGVYSRALHGVGDLARTEYLNGTKTVHNAADTLTELDRVDTAERNLVLTLIDAGLPAATVARRCRIAPATVRRWIAEETP